MIIFCCVYYIGNEPNDIIEIQINAIRQSMQNRPYKVLAACERLDNLSKELLRRDPNVLILDHLSSEHGLSPNEEHASYLDQLVDRAKKMPCDWIVTLDVDSFPIGPAWLEAAICRETGVSGVFRQENGDVNLIHPCGILIRRDILDLIDFKFLPKTDHPNYKNIQNFCKENNQRMDTGIGMSLELKNKNINWRRLKRSNINNIHYLMAGIYGKSFFHLGASSRPPIFSMEANYDYLYNFLLKMEKKPFFWRLNLMYKNIIIRRNYKKRSLIMGRLKQNFEEFVSYLLGTK